MGKSFAKAQKGIRFPPAPVSTIHQRLALSFDATGISAVAKASVIMSIEMSARVVNLFCAVCGMGGFRDNPKYLKPDVPNVQRFCNTNIASMIKPALSIETKNIL